MKKLLFVIVMILIASTALAWAQNVKVIKGEVIDISCYVSAAAKGEDHKTCAIACLQAGQPAGILEEGTEKIYVVVSGDHMTNPSAKVMPFVAKMVEVTGTVTEKGGVNIIDIKDIKESMPAPMEKGAMKEKQDMPKY